MKALKALALRLLETGQTISWWGNIRFEDAFSTDLARLLAASGCIALTAGLEAASDRLLEQMKKESPSTRLHGSRLRFARPGSWSTRT